MRTKLAAAVLALLAAAPCAAQFERTDPQKEIEIGRQAARLVEKEIGLSRDRSLQERVKRIGAALVENLPQRAYPYQYKVLASPEVNAFSLPGGFIYFYEGLIARLPDDDAVAFVLGHETIHAAHRHWHRIMEKMKGVTIAAILASMATGGSDVVGMVHELIGLQYSRANEEDADKSGLELMWRSGFDTRGATEAMEFLAKLEKGNTIPTYLSDHPHASDRLKKLKEEIALLNDTPRPAPQGMAASAEVDTAALVGTLPAPKTEPNPWFPLSAGSAWTYEVTGGEGGRAAYTVRVAGAIDTPAGPVYRAETVLPQGPAVACQLFTTSHEVWRRSKPETGAGAWTVDECTPESAEIVQGKRTYAVVGRESVTVPCGSFPNALRIREEDGGRKYDLWFVQGVGLVRRVCVDTGVSESLSAYRIAKK